MITASCPECTRKINLDSTPEIIQLLKCSYCQNVLEVTWLFPIILDYKEKTANISAKQDKDFE